MLRTWLYDGDRVVREDDTSTNYHSLFAYGTKSNVPDLMLRKTTGSFRIFRLVTDQVGSVILVYDVTTGSVASGPFAYDGNAPWGGASTWHYYGGSFGFAGGIYEPDSSTYRFGAREYNPWVGRWLSKDPIRFAGGLNLYAYCNNDPVNCADPGGLDPFWSADLVCKLTGYCPLLWGLPGTAPEGPPAPTAAPTTPGGSGHVTGGLPRPYRVPH